MLTESIATWLCTIFGREGYNVLALGLMACAPGLLVLFVIAQKKGYGRRFGLLLGFAVAVWASLCWLVVPYLGGYPNLPGLLVGWALFGLETWGQEITLHVTNFILFPFIGWRLLRTRPGYPIRFEVQRRC